MASQNTYTTAPDSNYPRRFPFTFPSLESSEVYVSVAGNLKTVGASNDYTVGNYNKTSGGYIEFVSDTTRGTGTVRIYRFTDGSKLKRDFQAGSAIKADDLNTANKQAIYLAEEARQDFTNLATSGTTSGFAIDGGNIAPDSITSNKIKDLEVKAADLSSSTTTDSNRAVTTNHIRDNAVTTDKLANNAVTDAKLSTISGTKISPDFGSQNIVTTGTLSSGDMTISDNSPRILFTELNADPDYKLISEGGKFIIREETNQADRLVVNSDGHIDIKNGSDVTGNLTVSGNTTFNSDITTNGNDIYLNNGTLISNDAQGAFADRSSNNIDHIWHDDSDNAWNFVSDDPYKATGNSKIRAGSFYGDGANLTNIAVPLTDAGFKRITSDFTTPTGQNSYQTVSSLTTNVTATRSSTWVFATWNFTFRTNSGTSNSNNKAMFRLRAYKNGSLDTTLFEESVGGHVDTVRKDTVRPIMSLSNGQTCEFRLQTRNYNTGSSRRTVVESGAYIILWAIKVN